MRSLDGTLYKEIANAFKYRKEYVAECRCKAEPWSKQARQQHESWEIEEEIVQDRAKQDRMQAKRRDGFDQRGSSEEPPFIRAILRQNSICTDRGCY